MKKITLLLILLTTFFGYTQNAPIDFETGGNGAAWTWTVFENGTNPPVEIIANPVSGGINTSATVFKFTALASGANWAGCESQHGSDIGTWTPSASNSYVTMKVYQVGFASEVALKFANSAGGALGETFATVSEADTWVEVSFDMSAWIGHAESPTDQIIMFPDRSNRTVDHIIYIDDVTFGAVPPALTSFSYDFETDLSGFDLGDPGAGTTLTQGVNPFTGATNADTTPNINTTANVVELVGINDQNYTHAAVIIPEKLDLSAGDKGFSIMVRGPRSIPVKFKIEGGTALDVDLTYTDVGNWQNLVYDFSSNTSINNNKVVVFFDIEQPASGSASDDIFQFDNIMFGAFASLGTNDVESESFKVFPNPSESIWNVKTNNQILNSIQVFDILGKQVLTLNPKATNAVIDATNLSNGLYFAKVKTDNGSSTLKLIKN